MARTPQPWMARVVSPANSDSDPAFMISFGDAKYLFNCPENTTRINIQRKYGLNKYRCIFLSQIASRTSAGLPGFIMTLADSGTTDLKVYGPPGVAHFIASTRSYLIRDNLKLAAFEQTKESPIPIYQDQNIAVYGILVDLSSAGSPELRDIQEAKEDANSLKRKHTNIQENAPRPKRPSIDNGDNSRGIQRGPSPHLKEGDDAISWRHLVISRMLPGRDGIPFSANHDIKPQELRKRLPSWKCRATATSYFVVGPEFRGKFNASLADSLGVPHGPARAKLSRGESITTPEGKVITPEMVIGASSPAVATLVIHCPDTAYIDGLINSNVLKTLLTRGRLVLHCVFHNTPMPVLEDERYLRWMDTLGADVHHIIANQDVCVDVPSFTASESMQKNLARLDPDLFRVPWSKPEEETDPILGKQNLYAARYQVVGMRPMVTPYDEIVKSSDLQPSSEAATQSDFEGIREKVVRELPTLVPSPGDDVAITCLGTGSAMPGKYRNVSGTLVQIPRVGNILLDCGEGTLGQIRRHFGTKAEEILKNVRCIFLSHIHADHHMGISRLLSERVQRSTKSRDVLYIICTRQTWMSLSEYSEIEDLGLNDRSRVKVLFAEEIEHRRLKGDETNETVSRLLGDIKNTLQLSRIQTATVDHRTLAFGLVLEHQDGWSLVYSGDTKPCQNLVDAGRDATLLIHEATMADDQVAMAEEKAHSTIGQAIEVAIKMKVKKLLLTHFSARYPKIPVLNKSMARSNDQSGSVGLPEVFIGFDFLHIHLGEFARAEKYLPVLESAFSELQEDDIVSLSAGK
ncbi:Metallo-hydrolase/oxidoreductase [Serendipita vermifera]|nr:Metallo-hydrolase/oxidoreductase [Serendipita vermifera]